MNIAKQEARMRLTLDLTIMVVLISCFEGPIGLTFAKDRIRHVSKVQAIQADRQMAKKPEWKTLGHAGSMNGSQHRSNKLTFDNEIVEGMNQGSLSSIESIANLDQRSSVQIYKRKSDFREEIKILSRELGAFR